MNVSGQVWPYPESPSKSLGLCGKSQSVADALLLALEQQGPCCALLGGEAGGL